MPHSPALDKQHLRWYLHVIVLYDLFVPTLNSRHLTERCLPCTVVPCGGADCASRGGVRSSTIYLPGQLIYSRSGALQAQYTLRSKCGACTMEASPSGAHLA